MPPDPHISPTRARRARMREALEAAYRQNGMTLLVLGAAGMGKSTMLRELAEAALDDQRWQICFINADEVEAEEPYSFVERLLSCGLGEEADFIPDDSTQPIPTAHMLLRNLRAGTKTGRVLIIDDAQWVDPQSQQVLRYVIPRINRRGVLVAVGARTPELKEGLVTHLEELVTRNPLDHLLRLQPLTPREVQGYAVDRFGVSIATADARRLLSVCGGTFLGVTAIFDQLSDDEIRNLHLSWRLPIRSDKDRSTVLLGRFNKLPPHVRATAEIVAIAGHELTREELEESGRLLGERIFIDEATQAGVTSESGFGSTIVPAHALVGEAITEGTNPERIRDVSRALAQVTTGYRAIKHALNGAVGWSDDLEARVYEFVRTTVAQGGYTNANEILRTALRLTPSGRPKHDLLVEIALINLRNNSGFLVVDLLPEFNELPPSTLRDFLVIIVGAHQVGVPFESERAAQLLIPAQDPDERTLQAFMSFMLVIMTMRSPHVEQVPGLIEQAKQLFERAPKSPADLGDARLAWMVHPREFLILLDCYALVHLHRTVQTDSARRLVEELSPRVLSMPEGPLKVDALVAVAGAHVSLGTLRDGFLLAKEAARLADHVSKPFAAGTARLIYADCLVTMGKYTEALALLNIIEDLSFEVLDLEFRPLINALRGIILEVTGGQAPAELIEQARVAEDIEWEGYAPDLVVLAECEIARVRRDPAMTLRVSGHDRVARFVNTQHGFLTYRLLALCDQGDLAEASDILAWIEQNNGASWQEYWGSLPWLRARVAELAGADAAAGREYEAASAHQTYPLPHALTLIDYAAFLARTGKVREAQSMARRARARLTSIGALGYLPHLDRGESTLDAPGVEVAALLATLTTREREIAEHLRAGHSNQQIADLLVVSQATVRFHVSNVLRKLGLSSRAQVAPLLAQTISE